MSGSLTFRPTAADLETAFHDHMRKISVKGLVLLIFLGVVLSALIGWMDGFRSVKDTLTYIAILLAWILVVLVVIIVGIRGFWLKRFSNRIYKQQRDFHGEVTVNWDDGGFETTTATGTTNLKWAELHAWKRTDKMLLLYRSEAMFHFLPLNIPGISDAANEMVEHLIANGVKARKS